ncbi:GNAT family N-acetyltransferase [Massilia sp. TWP1-3-3]|uniref:GNAT family N-acetyltransferase n=1 Tax=Massilia sp. TWP1-3-3 TaxID=2804573 RepID=UPI003CE833C3
MIRLGPQHLPQLLVQSAPGADSSYVALASSFGNSVSELDAILSDAQNLQFIDDACEPPLLLSVHAVDQIQGHARIQVHGSDTRGALAAFLQRLSEQLQVTRLYSYVFPHEAAEVALLEALGFTQEACFRDHLFINGTYADLCVYGRVEAAP